MAAAICAVQVQIGSRRDDMGPPHDMGPWMLLRPLALGGGGGDDGRQVVVGGSRLHLNGTGWCPALPVHRSGALGMG